MADDDNEEFEALKQEVLSLRKFRQQQQLQRPSRSLQESTLLKELQQKCDRIIDLEVHHHDVLLCACVCLCVERKYL